MTDKTYKWDELAEELHAERRLWITGANCLTKPTAIFYDEETKAKSICKKCLVREDCLVYALGIREEYGVWGGTTEAERKRLLRKSRVLLNESEDMSLRECIEQVASEYIKSQ